MSSLKLYNISQKLSIMLYQDFNSHIPFNYIPVFYENFNFVEHLHGDLEIIAVYSGEVIVTIDEAPALLHEGDFALILSNQIHSYRSVGESRVWVSVFAEDYVRDFAADMQNLCTAHPVFRCEDLVRRFIEKYMIFNAHPTREELCACLSILCHLFRSGNEFHVRPRTGRVHFRDILNYISEHYTEDISLTKVATELHLDVNYLSRCFHRCVDSHFSEFVNRYRVSYAQTCLARGSSMAEIAEMCGFRSIRTFNRAFSDLPG